MSYILLAKVNMNGGDVTHLEATSFEQAISLAKDYINGDTLKCAGIEKLQSGSCRVWFKNVKLTNPSSTITH